MELPKELKTIYDSLTESEKENYRKNFYPVLRRALDEWKMKIEFGNPDIENLKDSLFRPMANLNLRAKDVANWQSSEYVHLIALNDYCELIKSFNESKEEVLDEITDPKEKLSEFERLAKKEKESELLQRLKEQLIKSEPKELDYKYPKVFKKKEAELIFMDYIKNHLIDPYTDLSFIYQQLKEADLVEYFTHLEFAKWMKDEKLISERTYDGILDKRGFKSLNKSTSSNRLKDYHLITDRHINSKSEK